LSGRRRRRRTTTQPRCPEHKYDHDNVGGLCRAEDLVSADLQPVQVTSPRVRRPSSYRFGVAVICRCKLRSVDIHPSCQASQMLSVSGDYGRTKNRSNGLQSSVTRQAIILPFANARKAKSVVTKTLQ